MPALSPRRTRPERPFWPSRLSTPIPRESLRIERVIGIARLFLTAIAFVATVLNPVEPASYTPVAYELLVLFAAHSVAALIVLRTRQKTTNAFALTTHALDLIAATITLPMAGATNSFFGFFLFVVAAAAFRWGLRETVATTVAGIVLVLLHARLAVAFPELSLYGTAEPNVVTVRAAYLALMGLLLGYLAEESRLLRAETGAIVGLVGKIRVDAGLTRALEVVSREVSALFNAAHVILVVEELDTERVFRWDTSGGWSLVPAAEFAESAGVDRQQYLFGRPDHTLTAIRRRWPWSMRSPYHITALDSSGRITDVAGWTIPPAFASTHRFRRLITAPVTFGQEWAGRIFILDPRVDVRLPALAGFLQTLVQQVSPAVFNVYLLGRLRTRAGAIERARVARELHDGVIQSLLGVEMQLDVLRRQPALSTTPTADELGRLQSVVRTEVLNLRDLMQQMRPPEFDPEELLEYLASMVEKFGRDTGITARFATSLKEVSLPSNICFELARIVQEGLVNVRKHSSASQVLVRFGVHEGFWTLEIDDDGRGFPFEGRLAHAELDARHSGPVIIKERVRAIGGHLAIESKPGRGARLEVLVPQEARG